MSVRPTAQSALRATALVSAGAVVAVVTALLGSARDGRLPWGGVALVLVVAAVGAATVSVCVRRWGRAQVAELQAGYTTATRRACTPRPVATTGSSCGRAASGRAGHPAPTTARAR
ncbi:hypothetical protein [Pedococcus aerophilus]|uniref:hypothetical protein n=1 Tax=Pedococcus aerophilus TaxID=436356 RepID=UPI0031CF9AC7